MTVATSDPNQTMTQVNPQSLIADNKSGRQQAPSLFFSNTSEYLNQTQTSFWNMNNKKGSNKTQALKRLEKYQRNMKVMEHKKRIKLENEERIRDLIKTSKDKERQ